MCGSPTRERPGLGVGPGPRGTPLTTQLLHLDEGDPRSCGLVPPTGLAQGVATRHTGLGMCRSLTRAGAGAEVGAGPRADPVITQLLPRGGGDPRWAGLPPPTDRAQWVATARAGLGVCGGTTREGAGARGEAGPRGAPVIAQLLHQTGGDPQLAGLVLPMGQAQGVVPACAGLGMCSSHTRARAGVWVGPVLRGTPTTTQLLLQVGGDPRLGVLVLPAGQAQ